MSIVLDSISRPVYSWRQSIILWLLCIPPFSLIGLFFIGGYLFDCASYLSSKKIGLPPWNGALQIIKNSVVFLLCALIASIPGSFFIVVSSLEPGYLVSARIFFWIGIILSVVGGAWFWAGFVASALAGSWSRMFRPRSIILFLMDPYRLGSVVVSLIIASILSPLSIWGPNMALSLYGPIGLLLFVVFIGLLTAYFFLFCVSLLVQSAPAYPISGSNPSIKARR